MKHFILYQLPAIIWAAIIFILSSLTALPHFMPAIIGFDKLEHMAAFFVLCFLSWRGFFYQLRFPYLKEKALVIAFTFTIIYGYLDELHQLYVPGRLFDYFDLAADVAGAILFIIFHALFIERKYKKVNTR